MCTHSCVWVCACLCVRTRLSSRVTPGPSPCVLPPLCLAASLCVCACTSRARLSPRLTASPGPTGEQRSSVNESSSLLGGSPRRPCGRKGSPYHTGQLHPAVRVADLLQHINQMKTAEGYGFKQEYEVRGPAYATRHTLPTQRPNQQGRKERGGEGGYSITNITSPSILQNRPVRPII